jgi:hypothetical protein
VGISPLPPHSPNVVPWATVIRLMKDQIRDHHCATNEAVKEAACLLKWRSTPKGPFGFSKDPGGGGCGFCSEVNTAVHRCDWHVVFAYSYFYVTVNCLAVIYGTALVLKEMCATAFLLMVKITVNWRLLKNCNQNGLKSQTCHREHTENKWQQVRTQNFSLGRVAGADPETISIMYFLFKKLLWKSCRKYNWNPELSAFMCIPI